MTKFQVGQEVEVYISGHVSYDPILNDIPTGWRKTKIIRQFIDMDPRFRKSDAWAVQFPDGMRALFDAEHIRIDTPRGRAAIHPMETLR